MGELEGYGRLAAKAKRRLTEVDEMAEFSESRESVKAAYLRRKFEQGRGQGT